ncbi:MAG TPA: trigger factor, partial [Dehalococcoidia bacterium]|nr:trigger factor [Dehalococcoidia bacterium]
LEIEIDPDQMERSLDKAYRRLSQKVEVPGFRKGKTPRNMLERHVGRGRLVQEAIDILIPEAYNKAIEDEDIDAIAQPDIELVKDEPLSFKATVAIRPDVDLGDYMSLRVAREAPDLAKKDVDAAVDELRRRYALHEPVDRAVRAGDFVTADVRVEIDGREVFKDEDAEFQLRDGATVLLPGFSEGLIGMKKGEKKEIEVNVPEGEGQLAGKTGTATTTVKEVKEEKLPELDDEFAGTVGEGFATLAALRERVETDMRERLEGKAEEEYRNEAVAALVEKAKKLEFPPVLVDREIERIVHDQAHQAGMELDRYLELIKRSAQELVDDLKPAATERVKRSLVLSQLAVDEKIEVEEPDVDAEIERLIESSGPQAEQMRKIFEAPDAKASIGRSLLTRKTLERLVEIAGQDGTAKKAKTTTVKSKSADDKAARPRKAAAGKGKAPKEES